MPRRPGTLPPELAVRKTTAPITFVHRREDAKCIDARKVVEHSARRYKLALEVVDLDEEPEEVRQKLRFDVPLVLVDGKKRFSGSVTATLLEKILQTRPR